MEYSFNTSRPKLIYVFRINDEAHKGCLKVGETIIKDTQNLIAVATPNSETLNSLAHERIKQYTQTAAVDYELLHTESSIYIEGGDLKGFNDGEVHKILERSGVKKKQFNTLHRANEWYITDLKTVLNAIAAAKSGMKSLAPNLISENDSPISFRYEQRQAIQRTLKHFKKNSSFLWNAKMRFGKTLSALQLIKEAGYKRSIIITHRPVVDEGWFADYHKIFSNKSDFAYGSKNNGETIKSLVKMAEKNLQEKNLLNCDLQEGGKNIIYFASLQDLRGSELVGGKFDKNSEVFSQKWDFIIIDEAHEGTKTELGARVIDALQQNNKAVRVLRLSGTPFNLLDDFKEEESFTWDYVMEQRAKQEWDDTHCGEPNPYSSLPQMHIYTYDLTLEIGKYKDEDLAFNFREFFRVNKEGAFVHDSDIDAFLNLLVERSDRRYPYSKEEWRETFRHTLWIIPGVQEAKALSEKLRRHRVFSNFNIANVAGDGDDGEVSDALSLVRNAIGENPDETYSITLSCGKLTTGVSVPAWSAVFYLAGSVSTRASSYMQTIFRVQTPYFYNGRQKTDCYVFDFAPDRTLKVIAEAAKISARAAGNNGENNGGDRGRLDEFLNFCPIISFHESAMTAVDANHMMEQLKRVYVDRVVRNGFEDGYLYNKRLYNLNDEELKEFEGLKAQIGSTPASHKMEDIVLNSLGFDEEEHSGGEENIKGEEGRKKPKPKDKDKEKRKKERDAAVSILRGFSIRMPLMIYGAETRDDEDITIDNFTAKIDNKSWDEFMPKGGTKELFNRFKKYYDADIFRAAAKRIRSMARAADDMAIEERIERIASIFGTFRNPDKETVLTPWRVVNMQMADTLGGYRFFDEEYRERRTTPTFVQRPGITERVFCRDTHILEINSKSGLYALYAAYSVFRMRAENEIKVSIFTTEEETDEDKRELWKRVLKENVFVLCKTPMARSITRRTLAGFRKDALAEVNAVCEENLIKKISEDKNKFIDNVSMANYWDIPTFDFMKFNAVVGNPPYQEEGISTRKSPIYHLFYDIAFSLSDIVTLITPGRFLFRAGQTPKEWMDKMLDDPHFKVIRYFQNSTDIFPSVDIKGGVVISYRDANTDFGKIGFFSPYSELKSIREKVVAHPEFVADAFAEMVSSQGIYKFTDKLFEDVPRAFDVQGQGTAYKITSKSLEQLTEVFFENAPKDKENYIRILGLCSGSRVIRWIKREYVQPVESLAYYRVFVPEANGTGAIGEVLSTPIIGWPIIGWPIIGHTDTFLSIGSFRNEVEASNCLKYIKTKFARTMLGTLKATQHNPKDTWSNVPLQDFTSSSDIDWSAGVEDINRQLYAKYGLSEEEIGFIEEKIKGM